MKRWIAILSLMLAGAAQGALVHVYQETLAGGVRTQLSDETKETGAAYSTQTEPTLNGYIFTHWSRTIEAETDCVTVVHWMGVAAGWRRI